MASIRVRQARDEDRAALTALHEREWGGPIVVVHELRLARHFSGAGNT
ncbi:hypothetical protein [Micromonospora aurantiaca (nom. illeg.)]|nr:hypothetical protein [Micromonospora aurantiaca]ADL45070.1 hypothetical protein Micau_1512 [Micromonospora aurantiaca ATCC 27029]